jgi:hypothetical protein
MNNRQLHALITDQNEDIYTMLDMRIIRANVFKFPDGYYYFGDNQSIHQVPLMYKWIFEDVAKVDDFQVTDGIMMLMYKGVIQQSIVINEINMRIMMLYLVQSNPDLTFHLLYRGFYGMPKSKMIIDTH